MSNNDSHSLEQVVKDHKGKMKYTRLGSSGLRVSVSVSHPKKG